MTAETPKRRWSRLHVSTHVVLLFAATALVMANVPGNRREFHYLVSRKSFFRERECLHGWPLTYLWRTPDRFATEEMSIWKLSDQVTQFHPVALACDVLIAIVILGVVGATYEWWRRRRERLWRFSLRELMIVLTAFAVLFALLYREDRQRRAEQQAVAALEGDEKIVTGVDTTLQQGGPDWLWEILPAERFPMFQRVAELKIGPDMWDVGLKPRVRGQLPEPHEPWVDLLIRDGRLKPLSQLTRLKRLRLTLANLDAEEIVWLSGLGSLTHLSLGYNPVDDARMEYLAGLTGLEYLDLGMTKITDAGLEHLNGMSRLEVLHLAWTRITDAGLAHLEAMPRLKELDLSSTMTGDAGLAHLKKLAGLEVLRLYGTDVTDAGLEHLRGLSNLRELDLSDTMISDAGLIHLKNLSNLERLTLSDTSVRGPGLRHLRNLKRLEYLYLSTGTGGSYRPEPRQELSDEGVVCLAGLKNLKYLELSGRTTSASAMAALREALPQLRVYMHW